MRCLQAALRVRVGASQQLHQLEKKHCVCVLPAFRRQQKQCKRDAASCIPSMPPVKPSTHASSRTQPRPPSQRAVPAQVQYFKTCSRRGPKNACRKKEVSYRVLRQQLLLISCDGAVERRLVRALSRVSTPPALTLRHTLRRVSQPSQRHSHALIQYILYAVNDIRYSV